MVFFTQLHPTPPFPSSNPFTLPPPNFIQFTHLRRKMLLSLFLALFLPCAGLSLVFLVYICLLWYAASTGDNHYEFRLPEKPTAEKGLSASDLEKLPKMTGKDLVMGNECAVCLEDIGEDQLARLLPGCNHGFHLQCADTWLSKNSVCPVCRGKLHPDLFNHPDSNPSFLIIQTPIPAD